jgi:hypothetical protein
LILVAVLLLFVLPTLLRKKTSSGPSTSTRATATVNAMNLIDEGEFAYETRHHAYTPHLADLLTLTHGLGNDLLIGLDIQLDAGSDGHSFYAHVESDVLSLVRARSGKKLIANSCLVLKRASSVHCPKPPA